MAEESGVDYRSFKNELENYESYLIAKEQIEQEIEQIIYVMSGVRGIRYDKEPGSFNPELSEEKRLDLIEKKSEKEIELAFIVHAIKLIELKLSKLSKEDKEICMRIIAEGESSEAVSRQNGYTRGGMWKRIKREISRIL